MELRLYILRHLAITITTAVDINRVIALWFGITKNRDLRYWVLGRLFIHLIIRLFACTADSFVRFTLLASLMRSAVLICSLACSLTHSRAHGKTNDVIVVSDVSDASVKLVSGFFSFLNHSSSPALVVVALGYDWTGLTRRKDEVIEKRKRGTEGPSDEKRRFHFNQRNKSL